MVPVTDLAFLCLINKYYQEPLMSEILEIARFGEEQDIFDQVDAFPGGCNDLKVLFEPDLEGEDESAEMVSHGTEGELLGVLKEPELVLETGGDIGGALSDNGVGEEQDVIGSDQENTLPNEIELGELFHLDVL